MSSSDSSNSNQQDNSTKKKQETLFEDLVVIDQETKNDVDKVLKETEIDLEDNTDLEQISDMYEPSQEDVEKTLKDPGIKKSTTKPGQTPDIKETLSKEEREEVDDKSVTKEKLKEKREYDDAEHERLVMKLAAKPSITMHLYSGTDEKTGQSVWTEKSYYFQNPTKQQTQHLKQMLNRSNDLEWRYQELMQGKLGDLTHDDFTFLRKARLYIDTMRYNLQKKEMKYRFNMPPEDFERLSDTEHQLVLEVVIYRSATAGPFPRAGR